MSPEQLKQIVEALIFASDTPLADKQIKEYVEEVELDDIHQAVDSLNWGYQQEGHAFQIVKIAGGYQMVSHDSFAPWLKRLYQGRLKSRLSQAAVETLSVIAFKQPVSRTEIDAIRGVNSDGVLRTLLERKLVAITGRADGPGRPLIYGTTKEFLRYFGVNDIADLPKPREIEELLKEENGGVGTGLPPELKIEAAAIPESAEPAAVETQPEETGPTTPDAAE